METLLYVIFFISCLVLVVAVLLQPGKTDAGALFTSGISSAALNPRGTQSVLSKLTIGAATVFMLSALMLSLPAITGDRSVLDSQAPADPAANTNTANTANTANTEGNVNAATTDGKDEKTGTSESSTDSKDDETGNKESTKADGEKDDEKESADSNSDDSKSEESSEKK